ncbi:MAG: hypothetical protein ACR2PH_11270, partial [Desulfobulbia bacterium]
MSKVIPHPTSVAAKEQRLHERENLARQMRTSQIVREQAREQINPTQVITELFEIDLKLQGETDLNTGQPIPMAREIISALKARADIKFRLLDKVVPNLKATESLNLSMGEHNININQKISDVELAQRLQIWKKNHGQGHMMRANAKAEQEESCVEATFE